MDANDLNGSDITKKREEYKIMHSFYPPVEYAVSTLKKELDDTEIALAADMRKRFQMIEEERNAARIAEEAARNAAEAARIAAEREARIAAERARIAAEMEVEEGEKTKNWWKGRTGTLEFSLGTQGGGRRGKKKSKRMIKMKNAKNKSKSKSKSKSQSRRQRQKRRRHSRRV